LAKVSSGPPGVRAYRSKAALKAVLIGSSSAEEAKGAPRWRRKKPTRRSLQQRPIHIEVQLINTLDLQGHMLS